MNILILGSGGREHAICKSLLKDNVTLFCISETINPNIKNIVSEYLLLDISLSNIDIIKFFPGNKNAIANHSHLRYLSLDFLH